MLNNAQPPHWLRHWATPLWPAQWCCNSMRKGSLVACFNSHQLYRLLKVVAATLLPIVPSNLCTKASRLQGTFIWSNRYVRTSFFRSSKGRKGAPSSKRRKGLLSFMAGTDSPWSKAKPISLPPESEKRRLWNFGGQIELKSLPYPKKTVDP